MVFKADWGVIPHAPILPWRVANGMGHVVDLKEKLIENPCPGGLRTQGEAIG